MAQKKIGKSKAMDRSKRETFSLDIPKPKLRPLPSAAQKPQPIALTKPEEFAPTPEEKKRIPHVANALLWSATVTLLVTALFMLLMGVDILLALAIAVPTFTGFSILFYNMLEEKG